MQGSGEIHNTECSRYVSDRSTPRHTGETLQRDIRKEGSQESGLGEIAEKELCRDSRVRHKEKIESKDSRKIKQRAGSGEIQESGNLESSEECLF